MKSYVAVDDDADLDLGGNVRAEKQKRVDVCVGFLNDNKNKAEEMRQVRWVMVISIDLMG